MDVKISGNSPYHVAKVTNTTPDTGDWALAVRPIGSIAIEAGDIEIGAVELKNASDDTRAVITTTDPASNAAGLVVRQVGGTGTIQGVQDDDTAVSGNDPVLVGSVTADPSSLPANTVAGRVKRNLSNLKGIQLVQQANTIHTGDTIGTMDKATDVDCGMSRSRDAALTNSAVAIKASAGNLYEIDAYNPDSSDAAFICIYNTAAAGVTVGTTALTYNKIRVGPLAQVTKTFNHPLQCSTAISIAATKLIADNDNTAPTATLFVNWRYK